MADTIELQMPTRSCSKHGPQKNVVGIQLEVFFASGERVNRRYCMECWVESMDATMCQLVEDGEFTPTVGGGAPRS